MPASAWDAAGSIYPPAEFESVTEVDLGLEIPNSQPQGWSSSCSCGSVGSTPALLGLHVPCPALPGAGFSPYIAHPMPDVTSPNIRQQHCPDLKPLCSFGCY